MIEAPHRRPQQCRPQQNRRGGSLVEFALAMPLLLMMAAAGADFARLFLESTAMAGAAGSAAKYGAQSPIKSSEFEKMESIAAASSDDAPGAVPLAERLCDCPDAPGVWVDCLADTCPLGYGLPRAYVRVGLSKTFTAAAAVPGVPSSVPLTLRGYLRVQ